MIQNNTSNFYNIINNNNNIVVNSLDDPINQTTSNTNSNSLSIKKEKIMLNLKYSTKEVIKEESEPGGMSMCSSRINNKNELNSSFGVHVAEEKS